jgi:hypothetical protein
VWYFAAFVALSQGDRIIRDLSFSEPGIRNGWGLAVESLSLVFTVFFVGLIVFRARIRRYLLAGSEDEQKVSV